MNLELCDICPKQLYGNYNCKPYICPYTGCQYLSMEGYEESFYEQYYEFCWAGAWWL